MIKKDNILVVDVFGNNPVAYEREGIDYISIVSKLSNIEKRLFRLGLYADKGDYFFAKAFANGQKVLSQYKLIIVNEVNHWGESIISYVRKQNSNAHLVYQLWNPLLLDKKSNKLRESWLKLIDRQVDYNVHIVTFDQGDCEKYKLQYGPQYIPGGVSVAPIYTYDKADVFFIGKDKGRLSRVAALKHFLEKENISCKFWVLPDKGATYSKEEKGEMIIKGRKYWKYSIPYVDILKQDSQSGCILDIPQKGQRGLTWRPIEALHFQKKLITTFDEIQNYDFYKEENIFIWKEDNMEDIPAFLEIPYQPVEDELIYKYTFSGWVDFICNKFQWNIE